MFVATTYCKLFKIQRDQLNRQEEQLRFIANNVEDIIEALNKRVINENAEIDFNKNPLNQVFRGCQLEQAVNTIVECSIREGAVSN